MIFRMYLDCLSYNIYYQGMKKQELNKDLKQWFQKQRGYKIHEKIGEGLECLVYRINLPQSTSKSYALKVTKPIKNIQPKEIPRQILKLKLQSLILGSQLPSYPSIPRCKQSGSSHSFGYLVIEYFPNLTLKEFYRQYLSPSNNQINENFKNECIKYILAQIIYALLCFQNHGIVHRDIKIENIMLDSQFKVKIIDYSMSIFEVNQNQALIESMNRQIDYLRNQKVTQLKVPQKTQLVNYQNLQAAQLSKIINQTKKIISGSRNYFCPETIAPRKQNIPLTNKVDIWAFGVIAYLLYFGTFPIQNVSTMNNFQLFKTIREQTPKFPEIQNDNTYGKQIIELIKGCLQKSVEKRFSLKQIISSPFFQDINFNPHELHPNSEFIYQRHNPIMKMINYKMFIQEEKWTSTIKVKVKFIRAAEIEDESISPIKYNKFLKYLVSINQQRNGHHYLLFRKNASKNQNKKLGIVKLKCKTCEVIKDFNEQKSQILRIQVFTRLKSDNLLNISEINIQIKTEEILDDFLHAFSVFRS